MHQCCYEKWQKRIDELLLPKGVSYQTQLPIAKLPREEKLSASQISHRRHAILRRRMRKKT
jgi:hypothetical protein